MQPKMHCRDEGKLFAAVIDRQKTDINLTLKVKLAGLILHSGATFSDTGVPAQNGEKNLNSGV